MAEQDDAVADPVQHSNLFQEPPYIGDAFSTMPNVGTPSKRRRKRRRSAALLSANMLDPLARSERDPDMNERATSAQSNEISTAGLNSRQAAARRYVSRLTRNTLAVIMAGGRGERLKHLTDFAPSRRRRSAASSASSISYCRTASIRAFVASPC